MQAAQAIVLSLLGLVGGLIGGFFGAYMKRKGENFATHEDIDKLVTQVAAVTQTTKEIEAKISGETWDRQKRWEMKREVLFEAAKAVTEVDDALLSYKIMLDSSDPVDKAFWLQENLKRSQRWLSAAAGLESARFLVAIVCDKSTEHAFGQLVTVAGSVAQGIGKKDRDVYKNHQAALVKALFEVRQAMRKDLGVQSS